jgi:cytochrome c biogenesis protein CcmG, thiol:disulfide interchange protein DsbE
VNPASVEAIKRHPTSLEAASGRRRRRWVLAVPLAVVLVLVTWVLAFGLTRNPDAYRNPLIGHRAPPFALRTLGGGGPIRLDDFHGQVAVVNFWASWCVPCREEHPALDAAWQRYRDQGVVVLGIDYQDSPSGARAFIRELGGSWPVLQDRGSKTALAYGVRGVPETFFVSPTGRIAAWHAGPVSYSLLSREIDRLLAGSRR